MVLSGRGEIHSDTLCSYQGTNVPLLSNSLILENSHYFCRGEGKEKSQQFPTNKYSNKPFALKSIF